MIQLRKSASRGQADHGWLKARHTFSFAEYYDPAFMGYSVLRVINDDIIEGGGGFGMHPHRDMEIVTYVLDGALRHRDSMGNGSVINSGDVQYMSAGTGVRHSEYNASSTERVHLLQIWIEPDRNGYAPGYAQKTIPLAQKSGKWRMIASPDGCDDSIVLRQNASIMATVLNGTGPLEYRPAPGRRLYVHAAGGSVSLNGIPMEAGDGAFIENETLVALSDALLAEVLLFDLP